MEELKRLTEGKRREISPVGRNGRLVEGGNEELAGRGDRGAQFFAPGTREAVFFGAGIALDDFAELTDAVSLLAEGDEGHALLEAGGCELEALGIIGENLFVLAYGLIVFFLGVGDLTEIKLSVRSKVGRGAIFQVDLELRTSEGELASADGTEAAGVEGGGGGRAGGGRGGGAARGRQRRGDGVRG